MTERISPRQFHEASGVEDWRVLFGGAYAHFRTRSFAAGVALVDAIGSLADRATHHPDVDLRSEGVTVRLRTHDIDGLSERDVTVARQISAAARELDVPAEPTAVQTVQVAIDALVGPEVLPFWRALLGYREMGPEDLVDPHGRGPSFWFQQMDAPRPQRNRIHIDISVPHDQAEARVAAAIAVGGHLDGPRLRESSRQRQSQSGSSSDERGRQLVYHVGALALRGRRAHGAIWRCIGGSLN